MQAGASFNVGELKEKIEVAMKAAQAHNQQHCSPRVGSDFV
jgi:hypothetical protein